MTTALLGARTLRRRIRSLSHAFVLAAAIPASLAAQSGPQAPSPTSSDSASAAEGRRLLALSLDAYGSRSAIDAARGFTIEAHGRKYLQGQSYTADGEVSSLPVHMREVLDVAGRRALNDAEDPFLGGYLFHSRTVSAPGGNATPGAPSGFQLDLTRERQGDGATPLTPPVAQTSFDGAIRYLPNLIVAAGLNAPAGVHALGRRFEEGQAADVVNVTLPSGTAVEVYLDTVTHLVSAYRVGPGGPQARFAGYHPVAGVMVPGRRTFTAGGLLQRADTFAIAANPPLADSTFAVPAGWTVRQPDASAGPAKVELDTVAPGLYRVSGLGGGYTAMFAVMAGYVVAYEAPVSPGESRKVVDFIHQTAPGTPIRYVVLTHHHADHSGGVRAFTDAGATVLTAAANVGYFTRILASAPGDTAHHALVHVEAVEDGAELGEGAQRGRVIAIRGGSHARDMFFFYFPAARVVFQGDLLIPRQDGVIVTPIAVNRELADALDARHIEADTIIGVHGPPVTMRAFRDRMAATPGGGVRTAR